MVNYDPKAWIRVIFAVQGTVLPRMFGRLVMLGLFTMVLVGADMVGRSLWDKGLPSLNPLGHTIMGVAVGLLIVFRNNCSYDRYWEGRKLWGGIVNNARNLARGAAAYVGQVPELANLINAYALTLKHHLRGSKDLEEIRGLVPAGVFAQVTAAANPPSLLAYSLSSWIHEQHKRQVLDPMQARTLEGYVANILDCQGGCERILRTPIPFAYAVHIKQLLMIFLVTIPFVLVPVMGWVAVVAELAIAFGLMGIEEAGVEIEDPFGDDPNDLPVDSICATIGRDTMALAQLPPDKTAGPG